MKTFKGKALFLDRSDINTDEIIPAKYLTESTKEALKPYLLEDLKLDDFNPAEDLNDVRVIVTRSNFGCGSSREHAPWALEVNDINLVIAEDFARIFRQNMYNCGMMAVELAPEVIHELFKKYGGKEVEIEADLEKKSFVFKTQEGEETVDYAISDFDQQLVEAGGWLNYADAKY